MTKKTFAPVALGLAGILALSLGGAAPAAAHTGDLYSVQWDTENDTSTFVVIDRADGSVTQLGPAHELSLWGVEIYDETGYAVGVRFNSSIDSDEFVIVTWNHATGDVQSVVPVTMAGAELDEIGMLDSSVGGPLPDGTLLTGSFYMLEGTDFYTQGIGTLDPVTGLFSVLVELDPAETPDVLVSLATDPTTGITYLFGDDDDGTPRVIELDLTAGTQGPALPLTGMIDALGGGYMGGSDFDEAGTLWFHYFDGDDMLARSTGAFSAAVAVVEVGTAGPQVPSALAVDPAAAPAPAPEPEAEPELAAAGLDPVGMIAAALALLAFGGAAALIARSRIRA